MKVLTLAATSILFFASAPASAETARDYYNAKMELQCAETYQAASFLGSIPFYVGSVLSPLMTADCNEYYRREAARKVAEFHKKHPHAVRAYERFQRKQRQE